MQRDGAALKLVPPRSYDFTVDWLSPHVPYWETFLARKPASILEVGCYEGRATSYLIEVCAAHKPIVYTCVDTWEGAVDLPPERMTGVEARFDHNTALAVSRAKNHVELEKLKQPSGVVLPKLLATGRMFDLIYIDGSHVACDVMADAVMAFPMLRVGGTMIFDDYVWCMEPQGKQDLLNMPKFAIDSFVHLYARKVVPVTLSTQLAVVKTAA